MSKFIPKSRFGNGVVTSNKYDWSSKAYSKKEEDEDKSYRTNMRNEKERIESIPLEKLSFTDIYTEPFTEMMSWIYSGDSFCFQFLNGSDESNKKVLDILNGDITTYKRQDLKNDDNTIKIFINDNWVDYILIRGWGNLTGTGAYNLAGEYACKIQDTLAEFIMNKLKK